MLSVMTIREQVEFLVESLKEVNPRKRFDIKFERIDENIEFPVILGTATIRELIMPAGMTISPIWESEKFYGISDDSNRFRRTPYKVV